MNLVAFFDICRTGVGGIVVGINLSASVKILIAGWNEALSPSVWAVARLDLRKSLAAHLAFYQPDLVETSG